MLKIFLLLMLAAIPNIAHADVESKSARECTITSINYTVLGIVARVTPDAGEKHFKERVNQIAAESDKDKRKIIVQLGNLAWEQRKSENAPSDLATILYDMCIKKIGTMI
jgi:hypothetical protein